MFLLNRPRPPHLPQPLNLLLIRQNKLTIWSHVQVYQECPNYPSLHKNCNNLSIWQNFFSNHQSNSCKITAKLNRLNKIEVKTSFVITNAVNKVMSQWTWLSWKTANNHIFLTSKVQYIQHFKASDWLLHN